MNNYAYKKSGYKRILFLMSMMLIFAMSIASAYSYDVSESVSFENVEAGSTYESSFNIENDGNSNFSQITLSLSSDLSNTFNGVLSNNNFDLNVSQTRTISLTIDVPSDEIIENEMIGSILVSGEGINKTIQVYTKPFSNLEIIELEVKVDGKRNDVTDGETISREASPGDNIEIELEIQNKLKDLEMEDVEVEITIFDIDEGDDIEIDAEEQDIDEEDEEKFELDFEVPLIVDEDTYEMLIEVTGEDEDGTEYELEWTIYLEVEKERSEVLMSRATISPSILTCVRYADIDITTINVGSNDEDVMITIENEELDLDEEEEFELEEGDDEDDVKEVLSFRVELDDDIVGTFPIDVSMYVDDDLEETEILYLEVNECNRRDIDSNPSSGSNDDSNPGFDVISNPGMANPTDSVVEQDDDLFERISDGDLTIPALGVVAAAIGIFLMLIIPK